MRTPSQPTFVRHVDAAGYGSNQPRPMDEDDALEQAEAEIRRLKAALEAALKAAIPERKKNPQQCPFCASISIIVRSSERDREGVPVCVACDSCGANGPWTIIPFEEWEPFRQSEVVEFFPARALKLWVERKGT